MFKHFGGVDAVPLCLGTKDPDELVRVVRWLEPSFGGVNLEDISQPKCFRILDELRRELAIPVWHDDQQGTATVALAALLGALEVVGKSLARVRIVMVGMGAANVATHRLLMASGVAPGAIVACDRGGILHRRRTDIEARQAEYPEKWRVCCESNEDDVRGGIAEALRGADACVAFSSSGPGVIRPEWLKTMAREAIVFACANPVPEVWPWEAAAAGVRVFATGRGDFFNQVNNSLGFPAIFRGALDVRARAISDVMALAAAHELAAAARDGGLSDRRIVPRMDEWEVYPRVAVATALAAQQEGLARLHRTAEELMASATRTIRDAQATTAVLAREGLIAPVPG